MFVAGKLLQSAAPSAHTHTHKMERKRAGKTCRCDYCCCAMLIRMAQGERLWTTIFTSFGWNAHFHFIVAVFSGAGIHSAYTTMDSSAHFPGYAWHPLCMHSDNDNAHLCRNGRGEAGKNSGTTKTDATTITTKIATATQQLQQCTDTFCRAKVCESW